MYQEDHKHHCYRQIWSEIYCLVILNAPLSYIVGEVIVIIGKGYRSKIWILMEIIVCCRVLLLSLCFDLFELMSKRMIWVIGIAFYTVVLFEIFYYMMTGAQSNKYCALLSLKIVGIILMVSIIFHLYINSCSYHPCLQSIQYSIPLVFIIIEPSIIEKGAPTVVQTILGYHQTLRSMLPLFRNDMCLLVYIFVECIGITIDNNSKFEIPVHCDRSVW